MHNFFSVEGQTVLVTGSSRGIGRALAEGFAVAGARVIINGRHRETVKKAASQFRSLKYPVIESVFDVSQPESAVTAIREIEQKVKSIDILINNAGIQRRSPLAEMEIDSWREVIETNLNSVFYVSQLVARGMIQRKQGKIINISSLVSFSARPTIANYGAAKAGLNALTKSMATEWGPFNIQTNAIAPGYILTDLNKPLVEDPEFDAWVKGKVPMARWGKPEELIGAAIYLASDASSYVNGHVLIVDGGWTACL